MERANAEATSLGLVSKRIQPRQPSPLYPTPGRSSEMGPHCPSTCIRGYFVASLLTQSETWEPAGLVPVTGGDSRPCSLKLGAPSPHQGLCPDGANLLTSDRLSSSGPGLPPEKQLQCRKEHCMYCEAGGVHILAPGLAPSSWVVGQVNWLFWVSVSSSLKLRPSYTP